jgi:hypothetical protein
VYKVLDGYDQEIAVVRLEETARGLRVVNVADQAQLAVLDGVGLDFVERWSADHAIVEHHIAVVEGEAVTPLRLPGPPMHDLHGEGAPSVLGTGSGFRAYQPTVDGTIRTWRSSDGRTWSASDLVGAADDEPFNVYRVEVRPGWGWNEGVTASDIEGRHAWESVDGITWAQIPMAPSGYLPRHIGGGWLSGADGAWLASVDGMSWVPVPEIPEVITKHETLGAGRNGTVTIGQALFESVVEEGASRWRDLWILEFAVPPG